MESLSKVTQALHDSGMLRKRNGGWHMLEYNEKGDRKIQKRGLSVLCQRGQCAGSRNLAFLTLEEF